MLGTAQRESLSLRLPSLSHHRRCAAGEVEPKPSAEQIEPLLPCIRQPPARTPVIRGRGRRKQEGVSAQLPPVSVLQPVPPVSREGSCTFEEHPRPSPAEPSHRFPLEGKAFCDHHLLFVCSLVISVCCVLRKLPTASCLLLRLFILKPAEEQRAVKLSLMRSLPGNFQTQSLEAIVTVKIPLCLGVCDEGELPSGPQQIATQRVPGRVVRWGWERRGGPEGWAET